MRTICLHDKARITHFLQQDIHLHLYGIGDLDPHQWPYTTWYALKEGEEIVEIALLYSGFSLPVLLALSGTPERMAPWLASCCHLLPRKCYAHLSVGVDRALQGAYRLESHGLHYKMAHHDQALLTAIDAAGVERLQREHIPAMLQLYAESYPGNFFAASAFELGPYYGVWDGTRLVCAAGIHVFSRHYGVTALGNIANAYRHSGGKAWPPAPAPN